MVVAPSSRLQPRKPVFPAVMLQTKVNDLLLDAIDVAPQVSPTLPLCGDCTGLVRGMEEVRMMPIMTRVTCDPSLPYIRTRSY